MADQRYTWRPQLHSCLNLLALRPCTFPHTEHRLATLEATTTHTSPPHTHNEVWQGTTTTTTHTCTHHTCTGHRTVGCLTLRNGC